MLKRRRKRPDSGLRIIRASEIGDYSYCSRAWWYRHVIHVPTPEGSGAESRLAGGTRAHIRHGRAVQASDALRIIGIALALFGLLAIALTLVFGGS